MISKTAEQNFDKIWSFLDFKFLDARGSDFTIAPFEKYFPLKYAEELTPESARNSLHVGLIHWAAIEQTEHEVVIREEPVYKEKSGKWVPTGEKLKLGEFRDFNVLQARRFILSSFYNVTCLAAHKRTLEELIYVAWQYVTSKESTPTKASLKSLCWLVGISKSFLLAEWTKEILSKAIANDDVYLFRTLQKWLTEDTPLERFPVARPWLGTILLWYLGGKTMPRQEFLDLLQKKEIIANTKGVRAFNVELRRLRLIK